MVLRKLSIFGFKSFADKTEIKFGDGMTAVIGPNGCGKSNVVDSIRWVFGEQKASALRSTSMQDVIFSGTQKRQPLNMAEVTLTIANTKGLLPIEFNDVAITRRIYRSGESEYFINKTPSRLRDIHAMFLDTGVGSSAYTTIENNMINKILSDKAEERRTLFEEAAGVGKYKKKIKETQRKLDRTKQDLLRINDRVKEKERYVNMLGRQVEKAKRYKRYHDDLKSLEIGYENRRYQDLQTAINERKNALRELDSDIETFRAKSAAAESKIEKLELDKVEKENQVQVASRNVSDISEKINSTDREISVSLQSLSHLKQNAERFEQENVSFGEQAEEKQQLLVNIEKNIITRESELAEHTERVDGASQELAEFDSRVDVQREKVEELNTRQFELVHRTGEKQRTLSNAQTNLTNIIERTEREESELNKLENNLEEYKESLESCRRKLETNNESLGNHMRTRETLWARIEKEEERYHSLLENEKKLESKIDSSRSKLKFLEGLDASYEGYSTGVKALLEKQLPGTVGIVADLINIKNEEIIPLAEKALGSAIQTVVFKTDLELKAAADYLVENKAGHARMISLETLSAVGAEKAVVNGDSIRIHITTDDEYAIIADALYNRVTICNSSDEAIGKLRSLENDSMVVSKDGTVCYSNGTVVAGASKKEQAGILQRKQEIERLGIDIAKFQKEHDEVVHEKEICIINRDEAKRALVEVDEKLNTGRQVQQEQETNIRHYETESENIRLRIENIVNDLSSSRSEINRFEEMINTIKEELSTVEDEKSDLEAQTESAKSRLGEMNYERVELVDNLKNVELAKHGLANRIEQDRRTIEQLTRDIKNLHESKQRKIEDMNKSVSDSKSLNERVEVLKESLERQNTQREELRATLDTVREEFNTIINIIEEERILVKNTRNELDELSTRKHGFEVGQTRDEEQKRAIREKIYESYEIDLQSPEEELPILDSEDADVVENINVLKERLRRVGEVNMGAINEYEKENGEYNEMISQRDDLQTAVDDLERAIKKLNREARVKFSETFKEVQVNFREMFTTLFEGGEAMLELEEGVDPLDAAIKINVRPAGKKMRGVTLLSGGERALTAISLLFALYLVKPSAYCILDELDAPLDDANVDRFVRVLHKFAEKTQFIIITHNKKTMEAADLLYGVTQQESGISTVASLSMGDNYELKVA